MTCPSLILHMYVPLAVNVTPAGNATCALWTILFTDFVVDAETLKQAYPNDA